MRCRSWIHLRVGFRCDFTCLKVQLGRVKVWRDDFPAIFGGICSHLNKKAFRKYSLQERRRSRYIPSPPEKAFHTNNEYPQEAMCDDENTNRITPTLRSVKSSNPSLNKEIHETLLIYLPPPHSEPDESPTHSLKPDLILHSCANCKPISDNTPVLTPAPRNAHCTNRVFARVPQKTYNREPHPQAKARPANQRRSRPERIQLLSKSRTWHAARPPRSPQKSPGLCMPYPRDIYPLPRHPSAS